MAKKKLDAAKLAKEYKTLDDRRVDDRARQIEILEALREVATYDEIGRITGQSPQAVFNTLKINRKQS